MLRKNLRLAKNQTIVKKLEASYARYLRLVVDV